jgi:hypothetical protein
MEEINYVKIILKKSKGLDDEVQNFHASATGRSQGRG